MTFCSSFSDVVKSSVFGAGALFTTGAFVAAEYFFSRLPPLAKLYAQHCPGFIAPVSILNSPGADICTATTYKFSINYFLMGSVEFAVIGSAFAINLMASKLLNNSAIVDEQRPFCNDRSGKRHVLLASAGAAVGLAQITVNSIISYEARNTATAWGKCVAQQNNITVLDCRAMESATSALITADYAIAGVLGLLMAGTFIWSGCISCKPNRRIVLLNTI